MMESETKPNIFGYSEQGSAGTVSTGVKVEGKNVVAHDVVAVVKNKSSGGGTCIGLDCTGGTLVADNITAIVGSTPEAAAQAWERFDKAFNKESSKK